MIEDIERLAVNSWRWERTWEHAGGKNRQDWDRISMEFFGIYRLMSWRDQWEAAKLAEFIFDLAMYRGSACGG